MKFSGFIKNLFGIFLFLVVMRLWNPQAFAEGQSTTGNTLDPTIQKSDLTSKSLKTSRKTLKHHHRKSKKKLSSGGESSTGSQEEVTDQREVSQQSDETSRKKK
jgi:hypothetical protein